ncbi:MAG: CPBP family intramembrane glutamic endopeptidase [Gemmataceae bacterium]
MQFVHFDMSDAFKEQYERLISTFKTIDPNTRIMLAVALALQGMLEEGFFRGYLFNSVRTLAKPWTTIVVTALLFGLLHLVMGGPLGIERVLPSTILGLLLGWVAAMSGSATPSMLQHAIHNAFLIGLGLHTFGEAERVSHLHLALGAAGTAVGIALVWFGRTKPDPV